MLPRQTQVLPSILNPVSRGTGAVAEADTGESAAFCRDTGGAAGDQPDQGPRGGHAVAGAGAGALRRYRTMRRERMAALRWSLEEPNESDSLRTLLEQVLEDMLVGGFGAVEMELTGDCRAAGCAVAGGWRDDPDQSEVGWAANEFRAMRRRICCRAPDKAVPLDDDQLMYMRMNPRTHTPFGLGPLEVAFETVNSLLSAHRFAGKLASNAVVQYALWLNEATPAEHERLIRWWQDEIEGTGRVPVLSTEQKPEVLRFGSGTDADLRMEWQSF